MGDSNYAIGVDIGGTFTDCIVVDDSGRTTIGKTTSTHGDLPTGVLNSIGAAAGQLGTDTETLLSATRSVYHGSTVGTNALVEGRTSTVGLIATRGHGDSIFMMQAGERLRGLPPETLAHVAAQPKPAPLVPKHLVAEVDGRVTFDGRVLVPLRDESVTEAIDQLIEAGAEAFSVALLWSFANNEHELRVRDLIHERLPGAFVSLSHQVAPRPGEYQRTVATVINSAIGPVMDAYLGELEDALQGAGYAHRLQLMSCSGGVIDVEEARRSPVLTIGSGPTAGVIGSRALAARTAAASARVGAGAVVVDSGGTGSGPVGSAPAPANVVTTDMGGTTLDVGVIDGGRPLTRPTSRHGQFEYFVPTVDVRSIGAGGGSIVQFNEDLGTITVGPRSAGSIPGPACYGRGGTMATVTDADLVLGYLDHEFFLNGAMPLDLDASLRVLEAAGAPVGLSAVETAAAAARIVDSQMADAIRLASVQQGYDPRDFTVYAYGGAGPVHASGYARELGVSRVVVPLSDFASGWSAFGVATSEAVVVREMGRASSSPFSPAFFNDAWPDLEAEVRRRLLAQGAREDQIVLERIVDTKYRNQFSVIPVSAPPGTWDDEVVAEFVGAFEAEYARLFGEGSGSASAGYATTGLAVRGVADIGQYEPTIHEPVASDTAPTIKRTRKVVYYEDEGLAPRDVPVFDGTTFVHGMTVAGPAIIEYPDTTVVVRPAQTSLVDEFGSIHLLLP
ncbi:hydantoinase/oxoprolinase family protein [Patulibacter sp. NPDC049589]|uniref:hydantoinase/oxoprolinase family protein n=1 Tax=Patulibacter sp. NPDC049589 TaxID=3154731 RepID=UPI00343198A7